MADTQHTRINDKFALAYDRMQWVLQRHSLRKGNDDWKAVAFIRTNKFHLFGVMIREGVAKDDALSVCEKLPETFTEFLALEGPLERRSTSERAISGVNDVSPPPHTQEPPAISDGRIVLAGISPVAPHEVSHD